MQRPHQDLDAMAVEAAERVTAILRASSHMDYIGEAVSQLEHALQCAKFAADSGADDETVLGAMLHDVGHLSLGEADQDESSLARMGAMGVLRHEDRGASFLLRMGFSDKVAQLVRGHVQAKRYLVWKHDHYARKLSEASKATLEYQGGPMKDAEAEAFERSEMFGPILKLRSWDDKAKVVGMKVPDLDHYVPMMVRHIRHNLERHDA
jgi:phosphonate degradation associated HDIG domain protein